MPRLPTIRVIGSQFISTRFFFLLEISWLGAAIVLISIAPFRFSVASGVVSGREFRSWVTPLGLFVDRVLSDGSQRTNRASVNADRAAGDVTAGRFVHKRHELVGE